MTQHLNLHWASLQRILKNKAPALFLDFDGTLSPVAATPQEAILSHENKSLLMKLSHGRDCKVVIVSGRALEDLKTKIGIDKIVYVGNHGLEMEWEKINFESFIPPAIQEALSKITFGLRNQLSLLQGLMIEDKKLTLSAHYRMVKEQDLKSFKKIFFEVCRPHLADETIEICLGEKVLEVRPFGAGDKSQSMMWLLRKYEESQGREFYPIFIGNDKTNEAVFKKLRDIGLTIVVGTHTSNAEYYVKDTEDVTRLLKEFLKIFREELVISDYTERTL